MTSYGQFCPVAKAMEILDERWTLLVVRELLAGSTHFNELRRGNPKMSPALLSKRLRTLERVGVVRRTGDAAGRTSYRLTESGEELRPIVEALGAWGVRWIGELGTEDLDPHLLMWDIRRTVPVDAWPRERTVLAFELDDVAPRVARWWLVVSGAEADVCDYDPGFDVDATIRAGLRTLTEIWRGDRGWVDALRSGAASVTGPTSVVGQVPRWLGHMQLAAVPRPA
ncbi:winged helix-turn-helix transcriptional regulator [Nocardioides sp. Root140]|uniref:winged helix-turn-helix transcriptional regulator n=1 Tax=Nocardioides sp. Root140 TaxID=1736460 RepID=UPI0006F776D4|nr:helix-turn-helix domain-containing protein [Nocardioides sp. Root140]KQY55490.1 HxlR family transcriptional regulator [Nocardioides sp. Root140]